MEGKLDIGLLKDAFSLFEHPIVWSIIISFLLIGLLEISIRIK